MGARRRKESVRAAPLLPRRCSGVHAAAQQSGPSPRPLCLNCQPVSLPVLRLSPRPALRRSPAQPPQRPRSGLHAACCTPQPAMARDAAAADPQNPPSTTSTSSPEPTERLSARLSKASRRIHSVSDGLVNSKLLALFTDRNTYALAIANFYYVFAALETALDIALRKSKDADVLSFQDFFAVGALYRAPGKQTKPQPADRFSLAHVLEQLL
jgi:hypothetical protein